MHLTFRSSSLRLCGGLIRIKSWLIASDSVVGLRNGALGIRTRTCIFNSNFEEQIGLSRPYIASALINQTADMACFNGAGIRKRRKCLLKVTADVFCLGVVIGGVLVIQHGTSTYQRGFFCDDESIQHPVLPDTISVPLVLAVGITFPIILILALEFLFRNGGPVWFLHPKPVHQKKNWLSAAYNAITVFIFGSVVTQFLTEIAKHSVGRLRPHFLTLCNPDLIAVDCTKYVTDFECRSTDEDLMKEARLSFPSGHSSFAMYSAIYLILYLEGRMFCRTIVLAKPLSQLFLFALALFTCLSRISDYKHHWSDVLAGGILGATVSTSLVVSLTQFGKELCRGERYCSRSPSFEDRHVEDNQTTELAGPNHFENNFGARASNDVVLNVTNDEHAVNVES